MQNTKNKMRIIFSFIICAIMLINCKNDNEKSYYYIQYSDDNIIERYIEKIVKNDNNTLSIETKYYNNGKVFIKSDFEQFRLEGYKLFRIFNDQNKSKEVYLVLDSDSCATQTKGTPIEFENCYKGKVNVETNSKNEIAHFFIRSQLGVDGVKSKVFLDSNFVLIKEEFVSGYCPYYRIEKLTDKKSWQ